MRIIVLNYQSLGIKIEHFIIFYLLELIVIEILIHFIKIRTLNTYAYRLWIFNIS